jgi:hypothetical protein
MSYISEHICPDEDWQKYRTLIAERDALRDQLAAARNEALGDDKILAAANTAIQGYVDGRDSYARGVQAGVSRMSAALKYTTPAPRCDVCGDSGSVSTFDIDQNGEHIEIACPECTASAPHQIDRVSLADIEGYGTNTTPAPREVTVQEAARVLLDNSAHMDDKALFSLTQGIRNESEWSWEPTIRGSSEIACRFLRALGGAER